jgi:formate/nitrite transporter FocA (FNT family)
MIAFVLLGTVPPVLALVLAGMVYLTWIAVRAEPISFTAKVWWCLLVFLFNLIGYVALRVTFAVWRARGRPAVGRRS